jgi:hypothetical protein
LTGIAVDVIPLFKSGGGGSNWLWVLMLFISYIPGAMSNVYKERYLKGADLDVWFLNAWVASNILLYNYW